MHPGMMYWWKHRYHGDCGAWSAGAWAGYGAGAGHRGWHERYAAGAHHDDDLRAAFGVRRPLRFLAYRLHLDDAQIGELARILDELKTERAQAEVDGRRTVAAFADALAGDSFDLTRAGEGAALRVKSAERLREAVVKALGSIHALLDHEQREKLAYLIRTGALAI